MSEDASGSDTSVSLIVAWTPFGFFIFLFTLLFSFTLASSSRLVNSASLTSSSLVRFLDRVMLLNFFSSLLKVFELFVVFLLMSSCNADWVWGLFTLGGIGVKKLELSVVFPNRRLSKFRESLNSEVIVFHDRVSGIEIRLIIEINKSNLSLNGYLNLLSGFTVVLGIRRVSVLTLMVLLCLGVGSLWAWVWFSSGTLWVVSILFEFLSTWCVIEMVWFVDFFEYIIRFSILVAFIKLREKESDELLRCICKEIFISALIKSTHIASMIVVVIRRRKYLYVYGFFFLLTPFFENFWIFLFIIRFSNYTGYLFYFFFYHNFFNWKCWKI